MCNIYTGWSFAVARLCLCLCAETLKFRFYVGYHIEAQSDAILFS